ncbi:MAG: STAS domain-containing protein [Kutzneria sp.]|nr:STAS domain-containing protein [Kutzneria sp.]MBV9847953.1 STAS domain-containing protein [Kutzneria sp.]
MTDNSLTNISVSARRLDTETVVVVVTGEIDMATVPRLRETVNDEMAACRSLVLDLSKVSFLGSAGLEVLVEVLHMATSRQVSLCLVADSRTVRRPLEITGLAEMFTIYPTLDDALPTTP